jgi:hypothetical protein
VAGHADVGFLAVDTGRLVDAADRAGVAAQQLRTPPQDLLQQRTQRELPGQLFGHGDQTCGARRVVVDHVPSDPRHRRTDP